MNEAQLMILEKLERARQRALQDWRAGRVPATTWRWLDNLLRTKVRQLQRACQEAPGVSGSVDSSPGTVH